MTTEAYPITAECFFPGTAASIADARQWLRTRLAELGVPEETTHAAVLVLSELATNAGAHSRSSDPEGFYHVWLYRAPAVLWLEVTDAGGSSEPRACSEGCPEPFAAVSLAEGGRGLLLVEHTATRWWTRGDDNGRTVGAELALSESG